MPNKSTKTHSSSNTNTYVTLNSEHISCLILHTTASEPGCVSQWTALLLQITHVPGLNFSLVIIIASVFQSFWWDSAPNWAIATSFHIHGREFDFRI
jgi:hypothetical protein